MILPIRTSIIPKRPPIANYLLITINIIVFLLSYHRHQTPFGEEPLREWAQQFILSARHPQLWQFISYAFLHASYAHIFGNMFFLYMFGNNVNDRLGHVGYICFYLAGGVAAGIGHTLLSNNPVLGASGAVAAITGAFLTLFPKAIVTVLYWFFFIGTFEVSAMWFIAIKLILIDNMVNPSYHNAPVAYDAHLTGYGFGILSITLLLWFNLLKNDNMTLASILRQWNRRRVYRSTVNNYDPFTGQTTKKVNSKEVKTPEQNQREQDILNLRREIIHRISIPDVAGAAQAYLNLIAIDPQQVMPRHNQLDIANHLMAIGSWENSANAYEKLLLHYPHTEHIEQVKLMLGILYSRYLKDSKKAIGYLQQALEDLRDPSQITMCEEELERNKA